MKIASTSSRVLWKDNCWIAVKLSWQQDGKLSFVCSPSEAEQVPSHAHPVTFQMHSLRLAFYSAEHRGMLCFLILHWQTTNSALLGTLAFEGGSCVCVCSCCSLHTLFCGPRYWRLLLFVSFFFFLCLFDLPRYRVCVATSFYCSTPSPYASVDSTDTSHRLRGQGAGKQ